MNKTELVAAVAEKTGASKKDSEKLVSAVFETITNSLVAGDYDINNNNWTTVGTGDPTEYLANWYSKGGADYCSYKNDEYDTLYEQLKAEKDNAKRVEIIQKLQQILVNDAVAIIDGYYNSSMAYSKNVGHAHIHTADYYWITTEITPVA